MSPSLTTAAKSAETIAKVSTFVGSVLGQFSDAGGILADKLAMMRWERQNRLIDSYNRVLAERGGVARCAVPPKYAFQIIEAATLENDDELQDIWAQLLATAGEASNTVHTCLIAILKEMEARDARLLKLVYENSRATPTLRTAHIKQWQRSLHTKTLLPECGLSEDAYYLTLDNLIRLRCVKSFVDTEDVDVVTDARDNSSCMITVSHDHEYDRISITPLGIQLVTCAMPPTKPKSK